MDSYFRVLFSIYLIVLVLDYSQAIIKGARVKCENEGEYMDSAIYGPLRADSCIRCKCINKEVVCSNPKCPTMEGCHVVMSDRPKHTCCDVCKGCTYKGVEYKHNETWTDPEDSCVHLECKAGVVTQSTVQCKADCQNPVKVPGICCPLCPTDNTRKGDCFIDGNLVRDGESANLAEDKCANCTCVGGQLSCQKPACPVLNCPHSMMMKDPSKCCSYCEGSEKVFYPQNGQCVFRGIIYDSGKEFQPDKCTDCKCKDGSSHCKRNACPVLDCVESDVVNKKGSCCPSCKKDARKVHTCLKDGKSVDHGYTWRQSPCTNCTCTKGKVICYSQQCPQITECPNNQILVQKMGECCHRCADAGTVCSISEATSKTLFYKTFDGHHFKYDGVCKYLLTKAADNSFVVRLQNGYFTPDTIGAKLIHMYVKINSTEILSVSIGRGLVAKVNKSRVQLPYEVKDVFRITTDNDTVDFIMMSGLKIRYAKDGHVQVIVSKLWEDRLSGLCGNYNGLSTDDTTGRDDRVYGKDDAFANTWRIGGKCSCDRWMAPKEITACTENIKERLKAQARCMVLKQDGFKKCRKLVKVDPYYRTCIDSVCRCKPNDKTCECDVIVAYQKTCEQVGEKVILAKSSACNKGFSSTTLKSQKTDENKSTRHKKSGKTKSKKTKSRKGKKSRKETKDKTSLVSNEKAAVQEVPSADDFNLVQLLEIKRKYQQALEKTGKAHVMTAEEVRSLAGVKVVKKPDPEEEKKKKFDRGTLDFLFG